MRVSGSSTAGGRQVPKSHMATEGMTQ
jgi:hypothetical protein